MSVDIEISHETWNQGRIAGENFYRRNPVASVEEMHKQAVTTYLQLTTVDVHSHDIVMYSLGFTYGYCDLDFRTILLAGGGQDRK